MYGRQIGMRKPPSLREGLGKWGGCVCVFLYAPPPPLYIYKKTTTTTTKRKVIFLMAWNKI